MQQNRIIDTLREIKDDVRKKYKAVLRGIFGSCARGDAGENSDIDILVEFQKSATLLDLAGLGNFLEEKLNRKVDLVSQNAVREEIRPNLYSEIIYL